MADFVQHVLRFADEAAWRATAVEGSFAAVAVNAVGRLYAPLPPDAPEGTAATPLPGFHVVVVVVSPVSWPVVSIQPAACLVPVLRVAFSGPFLSFALPFLAMSPSLAAVVAAG